MNSPHNDPASNGTKFGSVTVTVDLALGDCVVIAPRRAGVVEALRSVRFHSLDEIIGAYQAQACRAALDPISKDYSRALKFAAEQIKQHQERRK